MKRKLYGNTITAACRLCAHGKLTVDDQVVLCMLKGVTDPGYHCRKFDYDPLRRIPFRQPSLQTFTDADFRLEDLPE